MVTHSHLLSVRVNTPFFNTKGRVQEKTSFFLCGPPYHEFCWILDCFENLCHRILSPLPPCRYTGSRRSSRFPLPGDDARRS
jgi:hypothetical protein